MRKVEVSLSDELDNALELIAISQNLSKSGIIEACLRDNIIINGSIEVLRSEPETGAYIAPSRNNRQPVKP